MAFKHRISFATDLAANFGCNRFRIMPDIVSKLLRAAIWSRCAVRFESEYTPFPRTRHRFRPAVLHRIRFGTCGFDPMSYFLLRDQWLIERLSEAMGAALVGNNFSPIPSKFSFHMKKKKWLVAARNLQSIKTLLTLELSQYRKSGSMFSSSEPVAARSDCRRLGNALCLCSPVRPAQAEQESGPKSLAVDFALSTFDYLLEHPSQRLPDDRQGLKLGLKLELCHLTNEL